MTIMAGDCGLRSESFRIFIIKQSVLTLTYAPRMIYFSYHWNVAAIFEIPVIAGFGRSGDGLKCHGDLQIKQSFTYMK